MELLYAVLEFILLCLPYQALCYVPFLGELRFGIWKTAVAHAVLCLIYIAGLLVWRDASGLFLQVYAALFLFFLFGLYYMSVSDSAGKTAFIFLLTRAYALFVELSVRTGELIGGALGLSLPGAPELQLFYPLAGMALVLLLSGPVLYLLLDRAVAPLLDEVEGDAWDYLWAVPASFLLLFPLLADPFGEEGLRPSGIAAGYVLLVAICFSCFFILRTLLASQQAVEERERRRALHRQIDLQAQSYRMLREQLSERTAARQDLHRHLSVMSFMLYQGKTKKALEDITEYQSSVFKGGVETEVYCRNQPVNTLIGYFKAQAAQRGIDMQLSLDLPQKTGIPDDELCVLLGCCLGNAIEACERMGEGKKMIQVISKMTGEALAISIDNTFDGEVSLLDGEFLSRKPHGGEGTGLRCVGELALRYAGAAEFKYDEEQFHVSVVLRTSQAASAPAPSAAPAPGQEEKAQPEGILNKSV